MKYTLICFFVNLLVFSYGQNSNNSNECLCFDGIGSKNGDSPEFTYEFSNQQRVSICGFWDHETHDSNDTTGSFIISEFNIFNCKNGLSYVEYSAMEICKIHAINDSIYIEYLQYLPYGKNWEWELIAIAKQEITIQSDSLKISELKKCYLKKEFIKEEVDNFLQKVESEKGIVTDWEIEISKLQLLALNGNEKAKSLLFDYEKVKEFKIDGAIAEILAESVSIVKWVNNIQ